MTSGSKVAHRLAAALVAAVLTAATLAGCDGDKKAAPQSRNVPGPTAAPSSPGLSPSPGGTGGPSATASPSTSARPSTSSPTPGTSSPAPSAPKPRVPVVTRISTKDRVVFITIDDGWEKDPRFVQQVRERGTPLTVFLTNDAAKADYGYFQQFQRLGAPIENHTMTHPVLSRLSERRQRQEICTVQDLYAAKYGARPTLLRPPYGAYDRTTREVAASCGIKALINWTAEYRSATGHLYYQGPGKLHPGDIILWHFNPKMPRNFDRLLRMIQKQGLRPAPLKDYLPPDYLEPTG